MTQDEDHLKLLSIFHYVVGGLAGFFALIPVIHLTAGLVLVLAPEKFETNGQSPPAFFGWFFVIIASVLITIGLTLAACVLAAGRCLARRKRYLFCMVIAGIECIFMPLGTVLGIFTIFVLMRPSVKLLFGVNNPGQPQSASVGRAGPH